MNTTPLLPKAIQSDLNRWYKLKPVAEQMRLLKEHTRFTMICAGRRSGKTERAKRFLMKQAWRTPGHYFVAAPTIPQVKLIYWEDLVRMSMLSVQKSKERKSELQIPLDNGSVIHLLGMEKPKRFEGADWTGGLLDEFSYFKEDAWATSIGPALETVNPERPGHKPWCWMLSKPNGLNHFYRMFKEAQRGIDPEWSAFHWLSSEVLTAKTLENVKAKMSKKQYLQEYEASFETVGGRIYGDYDANNETNETIQKHERICYFCDFNYTPMSHGIGVIRDDDDVYILDEIILDGAVGEHNALEFVEKYKDHDNKTMRLYGDRSGRNGEKHGLETEYITMERVLRRAGWTVERRVKDANPSIKDSQNAVRAKICNALGERSLFINPQLAPYAHEGLSTVQVKKGSTFLEDDTNDYQHITTAIRYFIDYEYPIRDSLIELDLEFWGG